jgi:hypothetical protein
MRKIMLNNMAAGFPADETFVRTVDEHRECLQQVCRGLFGSNAVILSGLEVTHAGGTEPTTTLSAGYAWIDGDIVFFEGRVEAGTYQKDKIHLHGMSEEEETGTYHSGAVLPTYRHKVGVVVFGGVSGHAGVLFTPLNSMKRISEERVLPVENGGGTLRVQRGINSTSLRGEVLVYPGEVDNRWLKVGSLQIPGEWQQGKQMIFAAVAEEIPTGIIPPTVIEAVAAYVKITSTGDVQVRVQGPVAALSDGKMKIYVNVNF